MQPAREQLQVEFLSDPDRAVDGKCSAATSSAASLVRALATGHAQTVEHAPVGLTADLAVVRAANACSEITLSWCWIA